MNEMTNQETDTALILENELKRRVKEVVERVVVNIVGKVIHEELNKYKAEMMMEISIAVGKTLQVVENEGRKPLWDSTPEEFGLTNKSLNTHAMTPIRNVYNNIDKELPDALRKQT
jgi:hypothetical protein